MDGLLPEVRLIGHVAAECRVVAEDRVLQERLARTYGLEEIPKVGPQIVVVVTFKTETLWKRLLARFGIVVFVPLF